MNTFRRSITLAVLSLAVVLLAANSAAAANNSAPLSPHVNAAAAGQSTLPMAIGRISFAPGATSATVQGTVAAFGLDRWIVNAQAGQVMTAQLNFSGGNALLVVFGADGVVLQSDHAGSPSFTGLLPTSEDYYLDVKGYPGGSTSYSLTVTIPPLPSLARQRIQFAPGTDSGSVEGMLSPNGVDGWVFGAEGGQTLSVQLTFSSGSGSLVIWGAGAAVLRSNPSQSTSFSAVLPYTEDYYIDVINSSAGIANYTLTVTIPPLTQVTAKRIRFQLGADSETVQGAIPADRKDQWVLSAQAGQTMTANLTLSSGSAWLQVWGADGTVLLSGGAHATRFTGTLPFSEDYHIDVVSGPNAPADYSLTVTIPPFSSNPIGQRISFQPGATSATVQGSVPAFGLDRWIVNAQAGQVMSAQLSFTSGNALLVVFGADGVVLQSDHAGSPSFKGVLPTSEDYYIDVRGYPGGPTGYSLTVTIPPLP